VADEQPKAPEGERSEKDTSQMKWYVIHTYSGQEKRAQQALLERARSERLEDQIGQILIPTESVVEMVKGSRRVSERRFFPGYMFVKMVDPVQNQRLWHLIKNTPKITGFVGDQQNPQPVPESQIRTLTSQIAEGAQKPKPKVLFEEGEHVRVVGGSFSGFSGIVEEVKPDKGKLRVLVSIFGRATPVELDFVQVEKS
jgi:transcriptional antiterminator NusG